jgi:hypothetical protein
MNWLRSLLATLRSKRRGPFRRVIVLVIEGLEPSRVDDYLEQGLLHWLALLSDIGARAAWQDAPLFDARKLELRLTDARVRTTTLPASSSSANDLAAICALDRQQQESLFAALTRRRAGVVLAVFDMPARLARLYGSQPSAEQQAIVRDVYARMDEIVGKAFSFVDDETVLLTAISPPQSGDSPPGGNTGMIFASCPPEQLDSSEITHASTLLHWLGADSGKW